MTPCTWARSGYTVWFIWTKKIFLAWFLHPLFQWLIHWCWVTHIYIHKLNNNDSGNGLSPDRRQSIIWTNAGILLIGPLGTNFNFNTSSFKKMHLKMSPGKLLLVCLSLNMLNGWHCVDPSHAEVRIPQKNEVNIISSPNNQQPWY